MALTELRVAGYRSLRDVRLPLTQLNVVVGPNGSGKSNLYRALWLIAEICEGGFARAICREGGLVSAMWAGPRTNTKPLRMELGFGTEDLSFLLSCGFPPPPPPPTAFGYDPYIKEEAVWIGRKRKPTTTLLERSAGMTSIRDVEGRRVEYPLVLSENESVLAQFREPHRFPELFALREAVRGWRFYHQFRTDEQAPLRSPQVSVRTPVLSHDGNDLAAALQTITEVGDRDRLYEAISAGLPGRMLRIQATGSAGAHKSPQATELSVALDTEGCAAPSGARTLRRDAEISLPGGRPAEPETTGSDCAQRTRVEPPSRPVAGASPNDRRRGGILANLGQHALQSAGRFDPRDLRHRSDRTGALRRRDSDPVVGRLRSACQQRTVCQRPQGGLETPYGMQFCGLRRHALARPCARDYGIHWPFPSVPRRESRALMLPPSSELGTGSNSRLARFGIWIVVGLYLVAVLAVNPFRECPVRDDWAYAWSAWRLLATGHYLAHDWASANTPFQAAWGAAFCLLFGNSFIALRCSTIVLAVLGLFGLSRSGTRARLEPRRGRSAERCASRRARSSSS